MKKMLIMPILALAIVLAIPSALAKYYIEANVQQSPSPVIAGNDGLLIINVANVGTSTIEKLKVKLDHLDYPLESLTSFPDNFGSVPIGGSKTIEFKYHVPKDTKTGFYLVRFKVSVCENYVCNDYIVEKNIEVESANNLEISLYPPEVTLGDNKTLYIKISNGDSDIKNIQIYFYNPYVMTLGDSNTIYIPELKAGEEKTIPVHIAIKPDAEPGVYQFNIFATYVDGIGVTHTLNTSSSVKILGKINLVVTKDDQSYVCPGKSGSVTIRISNAGIENVKFLVLKVNSSEVSIANPTIYIGNLDSDDYDSEKINFVVPLNASNGTKRIKATLIYQDIYGNERSQIEYIPIEVSKCKEKYGNNLLYYYIIGALAIVIIIAILIRKGKK